MADTTTAAERQVRNSSKKVADFLLVGQDQTVSGNLTLADAKNLIVGSTTGTKIGTAITQKLGFFNSTPIVKPAATTDVKDALVNLGLLTDGGATPLNLDGGALSAGTTTLGDAANLVVGTTTGTKIGTATTQKLGFFNAGPVVQRGAIANLTAASGTADGTVDDVGASFNQTTLNNNFQEMATKVNALATALRDLGFIA